MMNLENFEWFCMARKKLGFPIQAPIVFHKPFQFSNKNLAEQV